MATNWRAIAIGFVVLVVAGVAGSVLPVVGQIGAGLIGGFVAGYLAEGGLLRGGWHGLVAGSIAGIVLSVLLALVVTAFGALATPDLGLLGGAGVLVTGLAVTVLFALDSAIAGAIGGLVA
jgi:hypothetical protein